MYLIDVMPSTARGAPARLGARTIDHHDGGENMTETGTRTEERVLASDL